MARTCCPLYTIRCDAGRFKPSKSQKKVMKKFVNFILHGKKPGTGASGIEGEEMEGDEEEVVGDREVEAKGRKIEKELGLSNLEGLDRLKKVDKEISEQTLEPTLTENCDCDNNDDTKLDVSEDDKTEPCRKSGEIMKSVTAPVGMDPTKPRQGKAKLARKERWEKKVKEGNVLPKKNENLEKTVEDWLSITSSSTSTHSHTFTKRLVKADESDPVFISSFSDSLRVYQKYQGAVHGDAEDKCSDKQFRRFLCSSPLQGERGEGAFHMQYLIDGRIVAVGVIDILPRCVSSVYLYYDPGYNFLSLGTLTSLMEICLVREMATTTHPNITSYYLGFYIHTCIKMRYKGRYSPSFLCCPETYTWQPLVSCAPLLDTAAYSRLDRDMASQDRERPGDIRAVGVLYCRQATTYQMYQEILEEEGEERDSDRGEVEEYSMLVGDRLAKRMLLYRAG
eukprot:GFUD01033363.1.p1 GENE.GFUD01033363.1~~GFUD01033363.1.p1  ORF type:complete len:527 (+),score=171.67 GFUD01033363.1:230-1582(+)